MAQTSNTAMFEKPP